MATVNVIAYKYKPLKNGELPIKIRLCKNQKIKYISLNVSTKKEHWNFSNNRPKHNSPNKELIETLISATLTKIHTKILELKASNKSYTVNTLFDSMQENIVPKTVNDLFKLHIQFLISENRLKYMQSVNTLYNCLTEYNKHLNIYFSDMDITFLKGYEAYLKKKGNSINTIGVKFRTLRMIYNLAIENNMVEPELYPFKKYKVSKLVQSTAKRALTKNEITQVINYKNSDNSNNSFYALLSINMFTFSYYVSGINFIDMAYLTSDNIINSQITYYRKKTGKLINLNLHPEAIKIIEFYKYHQEKTTYIFPIFSNIHKTPIQKHNRLHKVLTIINKRLNIIGEDLKLPIKLTTYVARHSYATVLKRAGVSTAIISETLGHSSEKITQYYLNNFENSQIVKALENL